MLKGIDVAVWQGAIDFTKVKTVADFVIIKATEGFGFTDQKFILNQKGARDAGMLIGYYCFTRPDLGNTVEAEVDYLLKTVGTLKNGEVVFLDYEVSYAKPVAWCKAWLDYLAKKLNGYKGLVYLNQSLLNSNDWTDLIKANYGLWLAVYDYDPDADTPQTKWGLLAFRQYSNKEVVPGIAGAVDASVFYGDHAAYVKYGYTSVPSTQPPVVTPPSSEEIITGLEAQVSKLTDDIIEMRSSRDKWKNSFNEAEDDHAKDIADKNAMIESMQKSNAEMTAQLTVMSTQVKTAIDEKKIAQDAVAPLAEENKLLSAQVTTLQDQLDKGIRGYSKTQLFKAYFGIFS